MMVLYVKLGTMPGEMMQIVGKRKPVEVGDKIWVRKVHPDGSGGWWVGNFADKIKARCTEIRDVGTRKLYFMEKV